MDVAFEAAEKIRPDMLTKRRKLGSKKSSKESTPKDHRAGPKLEGQPLLFLKSTRRFRAHE